VEAAQDAALFGAIGIAHRKTHQETIQLRLVTGFADQKQQMPLLRFALHHGDVERVALEAGFLWHKVTRESPYVGLRAEIVNFVPPSDDQVELMQVTLTNITDRSLAFTPTAAIPMITPSVVNAALSLRSLIAPKE
jgi:hypothetical protein